MERPSRNVCGRSQLWFYRPGDRSSKRHAPIHSTTPQEEPQDPAPAPQEEDGVVHHPHKWGIIMSHILLLMCNLLI
jgi:hypothetical protein